MGDFSINGKKLSAEQIFTILDRSDGEDGKIRKDTWNIFAVATGHKGKCVNYMEHDNAVKKIGELLSGLDDTAKSVVSAHIDTLVKNNKRTGGTEQVVPTEQEATNATVKAETAQVSEVNAEPKKHDHYNKPLMSEADVKTKYPAEYVMVEEIAKKYHNNKADIAYWTQLIATAAEKYNVEPEILVAIIGREVRFNENPEQVTGSSGGPMQVTKISIDDFFPGAKGNRTTLYQNIDNKLLQEILYDENGNLKYENSKSLWKACREDHELGIKVGILIFKAKMHAVKNGIKNKTFKSEEEKETKILRNSLYRYNGSQAAQAYLNDTYKSYIICKNISDIGQYYEEQNSISQYEFYHNRYLNIAEKDD